MIQYEINHHKRYDMIISINDKSYDEKIKIRILISYSSGGVTKTRLKQKIAIFGYLWVVKTL